jgi:hypothetical protein
MFCYAEQVGNFSIEDIHARFVIEPRQLRQKEIKELCEFLWSLLSVFICQSKW